MVGGVNRLLTPHWLSGLSVREGAGLQLELIYSRRWRKRGTLGEEREPAAVCVSPVKDPLLQGGGRGEQLVKMEEENSEQMRPLLTSVSLSPDSVSGGARGSAQREGDAPHTDTGASVTG